MSEFLKFVNEHYNKMQVTEATATGLYTNTHGELLAKDLVRLRFEFQKLLNLSTLPLGFINKEDAMLAAKTSKMHVVTQQTVNGNVYIVFNDNDYKALLDFWEKVKQMQNEGIETTEIPDDITTMGEVTVPGNLKNDTEKMFKTLGELVTYAREKDFYLFGIDHLIPYFNKNDAVKAKQESHIPAFQLNVCEFKGVYFLMQSMELLMLQKQNAMHPELKIVA